MVGSGVPRLFGFFHKDLLIDAAQGLTEPSCIGLHNRFPSITLKNVLS